MPSEVGLLAVSDSMIIFIHKNSYRIYRSFIVFVYKSNHVKKKFSSEFFINVLIQCSLKLRNFVFQMQSDAEASQKSTVLSAHLHIEKKYIQNHWAVAARKCFSNSIWWNQKRPVPALNYKTWPYVKNYLIIFFLKTPMTQSPEKLNDMCLFFLLIFI